MTIAEIIKSEQETADFHQKISQMASSPKNKSEAQKYLDYHNQIINILCKYQKIKEIIQHWIDEDLASESPSFADSGTIEDIIEVIENGRNN